MMAKLHSLSGSTEITWVRKCSPPLWRDPYGGSLHSQSTLRSECEMCPSPQKPKCFRPQNRASNLTVWETQRWRRSVRWGEARWASPTQITSRWCWICPRSRASRSPTSTSVRKQPPSRCLWRESIRAQCEVNLSLRNMDARNSHQPLCVVTKSPDSPAWCWFHLLQLSRLCNVAFNVKIKVRILTGGLKLRAALAVFWRLLEFWVLVRRWKLNISKCIKIIFNSSFSIQNELDQF